MVFALTLPCLFNLHVSALTDPLGANELLLLIDSLREIEFQKSVWELSEINFSDLCIGEPVYAYDYINDSLQFSRKLYPITVNDQLVLWAIADNGKYHSESSI